MGIRGVHPTHIWSLHTQTCKGCEVHMQDAKAQQPCEKPYAPKPRLAKEYRKP